jgi:large subunit ribosomal protein L3
MSGLIGKKLGMTQYFAPDGRMHAVTVVEAGPCTVTQVKTVERDGYTAIQVGFGTAKKLSAAEKGHLGHGGLGRNRKRENLKGEASRSALGMFPHLREFPAPEGAVNVGDILSAGVFQEGQRVDITGISKGKGFAGGVRRYHFAGGPKTHGQSDRHRAPGSIGSGTTPGRVLKGLKMAGHLGHDHVTAKNLEVLKIEPERNLILIKGAVPGPTDTIVMIRPTKKGAR